MAAADTVLVQTSIVSAGSCLLSQNLEDTETSRSAGMAGLGSVVLVIPEYEIIHPERLDDLGVLGQIAQENVPKQTGVSKAIGWK